MVLLDTAHAAETTPLPADFLIQPPNHKKLLPIASATQIELGKVAQSFHDLVTHLNDETETELGIASTAVTYPTSQFTREELVDIIFRRVDADQRVLEKLLEILKFFSHNPLPNSSVGLPDSFDLHSTMDYLVTHNYLHPKSPTSTTLHRTFWYIEGLVNQWIYSSKPASQMDKELLQRYEDMAKSLFKGSSEEQGVAAERYTNQQYVIELIKNGLRFLQQPLNYNSEPILSKNPRILIVGPGNGKVESKILSELNFPLETVEAIDVLSENQIGSKPESMTVNYQTDLLEWAKDPSNADKYDLILCIGSTLVNHEDYLKHLEYAHATQKLLKDGGIYCYETRALEPNMKHNSASLRSKQFVSKHPLRPPGTASSTHFLEHSNPEDFGASMQPWQLQSLIFDLVGLGSLNYPLSSPESEDHYFESLKDNDYVLSQLRRNPALHNPILEPVWQAGEGNYRIAHFLRKLPNTDTTMATVIERLFGRALEHPLSARHPLPV